MNIKKYCHFCAGELTKKHVDGRTRLFCSRCKKPIYENPLPATAAVLINDNDEILMVKRKVEPKKGEWCLPGGFIELAETPEKGCLRELREETGLEAEVDRLVGVFPSKSPIHNWVLVIGYVIKNAQGTVTAGDDCVQAAYFKLDQAPPVAFKSHRAILQTALNGRDRERTGLKNRGEFGAYVITGGDHIEIARKACKAGAKILQYRDKTSCRNEILKRARAIRKITATNETLFIVNDYIDIALLVKADGVHLGQDDIPVAEAGKLTPPGFIIGCSTHSLEQAAAAERAGADYIGSGPVFATPTKESYPPIGIECVKQVISTVKIPVVAIGGLNPDNIAELRSLGVKNFAMVRAFRENTAEVVKKINNLSKQKI
ncbi:MAG: thiamine phosphate synthase [Candidatus Aminicenantes bacterium]|nr:thiamine phosphate synthase [Candidatus Aminicenantes bacterium]